MNRHLRRGAWGALAILVAGYAAIHLMVWRNALARLAEPPQRPADAALILGNRAYKDGRPNPCLTGRVDAGLALAQAGTVRQLVFSGGVDREDGRIEAEVMEQHARSAGYTGALLLEPASQSTRENLSMSRGVLEAAGIRSVVIVTEPYHLWRAERLVRATGFDRLFEVQFAAATSSCWQTWGMAFKGALREPFAIVNNAANGYLH
ncbi:YdcF family protein [Variovorax saccharolyticus]|uniref:YdcF family protein n=1 Tax=Variovorax saccharolyticus TaxID=3053516 RepID=UPI0025784C36|nr:MULTISPECIES: YdcF family protein [unclassified Variovorax]MDM0017706.1 YdcF family protein [Variovorax sp. J22R187]MDM0024678.1 YdcF family protein [Variovorax sp. J31P216]